MKTRKFGILSGSEIRSIWNGILNYRYAIVINGTGDDLAYELLKISNIHCGGCRCVVKSYGCIKDIGIDAFVSAMDKASVAVMYNAPSMMDIVERLAEEENSIKWPPIIYDLKKARKKRWKRLVDLANNIEIEHEDEPDPELAKRCFLVILMDGLDLPF